jgi:hypothetical protein
MERAESIGHGLAKERDGGYVAVVVVLVVLVVLFANQAEGWPSHVSMHQRGCLVICVHRILLPHREE